jgi:cyanobactin cluster PatC/TenC/TruC protein
MPKPEPPSKTPPAPSETPPTPSAKPPAQANVGSVQMAVKSYLPATQTGLQDYAYWCDYARKHAKQVKGAQTYRRGRIWA